MILVELAGAGGVGKSTIAPLIAQRLREKLGEDAVAALPEQGVARSQRRWTRIKRWIWTATHPGALLAARQLGKAVTRVARFSVWMRAFTTMGIGKAVVQKGVKVALVDQGLLRLPMSAGHAALIPQKLLPDLVLHLVAEPAVLEMRRIYRSKPKHNRHSGEKRLSSARDTLSRLRDLAPDQLRDAAVKFGEKFCEPPFSEDELRQLLNTPFLEPVTAPAGAAQKGRCKSEVCETFRQRGVLWREIDNSSSDGFEAALEACTQAILSNLSASDPGLVKEGLPSLKTA